MKYIAFFHLLMMCLIAQVLTIFTSTQGTTLLYLIIEMHYFKTIMAMVIRHTPSLVQDPELRDPLFLYELLLRSRYSRSANSPFVLMKINTELITRLTMAKPANSPGALPHSAISTLMNINKNIEFKNKTAAFILKLLRLINRFLANILAIIEFRKELFQHRVNNRLYAIIRFQVLFSNISEVYASMN